MNQKLQNIFDIIQQSTTLNAEQKDNLLKAIKDADKELEITAFKLERTEKVKKTTAILLEETIEELEQKRKAVEAQNRELEIETALEKVRSIAMAMRKPDDMLDVCKTISRQLETLGVMEIRNVQTAIFYEQRGTYRNYEYYAKHDKTVITETTYTNNKLHEEFALKMLKGKGEYFITHIKGEEVKDWIEYQKTTNVFIDKYLETASSLNYYWFSLGPVALGISTYHPLKEEEINLFKRFLKVFELAYRRYLDIEKAEAQAKEAQIQLALERVRARTMAMQHSVELQDTAVLLFNQINLLGIETGSCGFIIWDEKDPVATVIMSSPEGKLQPAFKLPHDKSNIYKRVFDAKHRGEDILVEEVSGEDLKSHFDYLTTIPVIGEIILKLRQIDYQFPKLIIYNFAFFKQGYLSFHLHAPNQEAPDIIKRFAKAFEQTYTRFLDLQKAEAQAREAQIEAALERVRSRTMGMQKSSELKEVIQLVYEQFVHLNIHVEHTGFIMDYKIRDDLHIWLADQREIPSEITIPCFDSPPNNSIREAKVKGQDFFKYFLSFEEKNKFYRDLFKFIPGVPEESLEYYFNCPGLAGSGVLLENVGLYIENFSGTSYTDEENKILMRFGKVFQQTYTRFLDLKKAEAQARESRIEASLERVRSRTMGMQHSSELQDASDLLFRQVKDLGVPAFSCGYNIWEKGEKECTAWMSDPSGGGINPAFKIPLTEDPNFIRFRESKQKKEEFYVLEMRGERMQEHYQYLRKTISVFDEAFKKVEAAGLTLPETQIHHLVNFDHGNVMFITLEPVPDAYDIFKRFAKVFEQTYTRFLDLKKAEAQARESQIQLGLERVRARSLAMHHSSELQGVVDAVSQQFNNLGINANGGVFITINDEVDEDLPIWGSSGAAKYVQKVTIPYLDKPIFTGLRDAIKNRNDFLIEEYTYIEKIEFFRHLFNHPPWNLLPPKRKKELLSREGGYIRSLTVSRYTSIFIINHNGEKFSESDNEILKRFGKVFEQSYTRFLDLQKAESQNKIIQAENERKTKELDEARELQLAMLPKQIPDYPGIDIKVYMQTATEVGGDYYDFSYRDDGSINIAIGDATGHGMKAGTLVTMMKSFFIANSSSKDIDDFFTSSNAAIKNSNLKRMMAGFAMLNIKDHKARFINAAMPSLYHYRKRTGKVEEIEQHNLPLGAMAIEKYKSTEISLNKGDVLIMMSDGFPELHDPNGELFGYERVYAAIQKVAEKEPEEIIKSLNDESLKWIGNKDLQDDVTFVVIKFR